MRIFFKLKIPPQPSGTKGALRFRVLADHPEKHFAFETVEHQHYRDEDRHGDEQPRYDARVIGEVGVILHEMSEPRVRREHLCDGEQYEREIQRRSRAAENQR